jgi:uncharacterized repeat protein (TIGR02543 family)
MKRAHNKVLSWLLAVCLCFGLFAGFAPAHATEAAPIVGTPFITDAEGFITDMIDNMAPTIDIMDRTEDDYFPEIVRTTYATPVFGPGTIEKWLNVYKNGALTSDVTYTNPLGYDPKNEGDAYGVYYIGDPPYRAYPALTYPEVYTDDILSILDTNGSLSSSFSKIFGGNYLQRTYEELMTTDGTYLSMYNEIIQDSSLNIDEKASRSQPISLAQINLQPFTTFLTSEVSKNALANVLMHGTREWTQDNDETTQKLFETYDPTDEEANPHNHVTVDEATGEISVSDCPFCNTEVDYALAQTTTSVGLEIEDFHISYSPENLDFDFDDVRSLLNGLVLDITLKGVDNKSVTFEFTITENSVTSRIISDNKKLKIHTVHLDFNVGPVEWSLDIPIALGETDLRILSNAVAGAFNVAFNSKAFEAVFNNAVVDIVAGEFFDDSLSTSDMDSTTEFLSLPLTLAYQFGDSGIAEGQAGTVDVLDAMRGLEVDGKTYSSWISDSLGNLLGDADVEVVLNNETYDSLVKEQLDVLISVFEVLDPGAGFNKDELLEINKANVWDYLIQKMGVERVKENLEDALISALEDLMPTLRSAIKNAFLEPVENAVRGIFESSVIGFLEDIPFIGSFVINSARGQIDSVLRSANSLIDGLNISIPTGTGYADNVTNFINDKLGFDESGNPGDWYEDFRNNVTLSGTITPYFDNTGIELLVPTSVSIEDDVTIDLAIGLSVNDNLTLDDPLPITAFVTGIPEGLAGDVEIEYTFASDNPSAVSVAYVDGLAVLTPGSQGRANITVNAKVRCIYDNTPEVKGVSTPWIELEPVTISAYSVGDPVYTLLNFETNGGEKLESKYYIYGSTVDLSGFVPEREHFAFDGWYSDEQLTKKITKVTMDYSKTIYAGWKLIWFDDVLETDWYYDEVNYVYMNNLMEGVSDEPLLFSPEAPLTRSMVYTILARMDGLQITGADWIETATDWAVEGGVSDGTNPEGDVTRQQLVTMLYRFALASGWDTSKTADLSDFADIDEVSDYALAAMRWAVAEGIINGKPGKIIDPQGFASRAECAAIIMRYCEL